MAEKENVLREFVATLGWKVDEQQFAKMQASLSKITDNIAEIGTAIAVTAGVVDKYVTQMAKQFEKLHYVSQQTGASVKSLQALEFGAQQIGFAAGEATGLVEGLANALAANPGLRGETGIFGGMGTDNAKNLITVLDRLHKMDPTGQGFGHAIASQYAAQMGMSEPQYRLAEKNLDRLKQAQAMREKMFAAAGLNPDSFGDKSMEFMNQMRMLMAGLEILGVLLASHFMPAVQMLVGVVGHLVTFTSWADKVTGGITTDIGALVALVLGFMKIVLPVVTSLMRLLGITGVGGEAAAGAAAATVGGGEAAAGGLMGMLALVDWPIIIGVIVAALTAYGLYKLFTTDTGTKMRNGAINLWNRVTGEDGEQGVKGNNPTNMRPWAGFKGSTFSRGKNGDFIAFPSANAGLMAAVSQLLIDDGRGQNTLTKIFGGINGHGGWSPASENNLSNVVGGMSSRLGVGKDDALPMHDPVFMARFLASLTTGEQGRNPYLMSTIQSAVNQRLGGGGGANLQTTITVNGAGDPKAVGDHVLGGQKQVFSDAQRYFAAKVN